MISMANNIVDKNAVKGLDAVALKALKNRLKSEIAAAEEQDSQLKKSLKLVEAEV